MALHQPLPQKPEARAEKVEDLVARVRQGKVRIPTFQRGLKWNNDNVAELFDSLYRGYPVGSLLLLNRGAKAQKVQVGPLSVQAPELAEAWWVVDGQQRLTSLTACLTRDLPLPKKREKDDPFVLYFDPRKQSFEKAPVSGEISTTWVPLPVLLDGAKLTEWVFNWSHGQDEALRRTVFEAGSRIREYSIPLYVIETEEKGIAEKIFYRTNNAGVKLRWTEIHKALYGDDSGSPSTLEELARDLSAVGMGRLDEDRLLTCLMALRGGDPTRSLDEHHRRDPDFLKDAVPEALPVLRRVLSFLRRDASIPHLRLLPKSILLDVLTRFFFLFPEPAPRSRALLSRWYWRTVLGAGKIDDRTLRRRGIRVQTEGEEEESVQRLLELLHQRPPQDFELPPAFDARAEGSRIALLALAGLGPRHLETGIPIDVPALIEGKDREAFAKIAPRAKGPASKSPANRIIHSDPRRVPAMMEGCLAGGEEGFAVLRSHGIGADAAERFWSGNIEEFLSLRSALLTEEVRRFLGRGAAWEQNDRPSIEHILGTVAAP